MNKKISTILLSLLSILFFSCTDLSKNFVLDVNGIRDSIQLTYEFSETGVTYRWTKPSNLNTFAKYFLISEDSRDEASDSIKSCKAVDPSYRADSYEHHISKSFSSVTFSWRFNDRPLYLWVVSTSGYYYNLGEFTCLSTNIEVIKKTILFNIPNTNGLLIFRWSIPNYININPSRFFISEDSSDSYKYLPNNFPCININNDYIEPFYDSTTTSIKRNCYTVEKDYKVFEITAVPSIITKSLYLWIEIEDGTMWNLGSFDTQVQFYIETIQKSTNPTYIINHAGSTFSWTHPNLTKINIEYYLIAEDTGIEANSLKSCMIVDSSYQDGNNVRIKNSFNSVLFGWKYNSKPLYLWAYIDSTFYNLGEFKTTKTDIENLKKEISISLDSNGYTTWSIPSTVPINPLRFIISDDSQSSYSAEHKFSCKEIDGDYLDSYYNDQVSINGNRYTEKEGKRLYSIRTKTRLYSLYYLWIQIEDGSWHNLGKIDI